MLAANKSLYLGTLGATQLTLGPRAWSSSWRTRRTLVHQAGPGTSWQTGALGAGPRGRGLDQTAEGCWGRYFLVVLVPSWTGDKRPWPPPWGVTWGSCDTLTRRNYGLI